MYLHKWYKPIIALLLSLAIALSGIIIVNYPSLKRNFIQFGSKVDAVTGTWVQKAMGPELYPGGGFTIVELNGKMYLYGGAVKINGNWRLSDQLWVYDPMSNTWTQKANGPIKLTGHVAAAINGKMYVYGGYYPVYTSDTIENTGMQTGLYEYNPEIDSWAKINNGPQVISEAKAVAVNNKMYILGGGTLINNSSKTISTMFVFDLVTSSWSSVNGLEATSNYAAAVIDDKIYKFGGMTSTGSGSKQLSVYDTTIGTWHAYNSSTYYTYSGIMGVIKNKLYILRIRPDHLTTTEKTFIFDPSSSTWQETISESPSNAHGTAVTINNKIYIYGYYGLWEYSANSIPAFSVNTPLQNSSFSETDTNFNPQIFVSDEDNEILTCKYYIDSETSPRDTKTVASTATPQNVSFNNLNIGALIEGNHTIKYEITDGYDTPAAQTVSFKIDKSAPILGSFMGISTINNITLYGSANDNIGGLNINPYRYTIGSEVSSWINVGTYTSNNNLLPNTQYLCKFEARDANGHIATSTQNIYTKAAVPSLSVNNASSYTLDIVSSDNNSAATQYQISVNNGTQYVTQEGNLTSAPTWITLINKRVTIQGLNPSGTYTFTAKARNAENIETAVSSAASGTTLVAPPGSPSNIIATATDKTITVSWDAVSGAIGYDIEADGAVVNTNTATTYTHANLNPGTPHTYRVRAKNAGGPGNWSAAISKSTLPGSPDIPQNLNAIPLSTSVTITWNNVPGATGYDIEVDGVLVNNGPNTNYIHSSLAPGTHHSYRVRSINPGGKSEWSGYVNTTTLLDTVPVPVNITAVPSLNNITLSWNAVNGASGYDIEVDGVTYDNSTRTTYTHSNLATGTQHIYRIRAKKGGINSEWSAALVSSTLTNAFGTPVNFKANVGDTSVALSWDPVPEAEGYEVEIDGIAIDNGIETTCIHNGLLPGSNHTYRVRAKNAEQTSEWAQPLTVTIYTLQTPQNITATSDETSITIAWDAVNGATSYDIDFDGSIISNVSAGPDIQTTTEAGISVTTEAAITATYTVNGLAPNTQHVIKVRAVNGSGVSNWSTPLTQSTRFTNANVPVVSGLAKKTSITVMWNSMESAVSYDVEADGSVTSNITGTAYNATGLNSGTQHTYRVRARNSSGTGEWGDTFTVSTLPQGPAAPSNITTSSNMTSILLTWDKVAGAEEYEIEVDGNIVNNGAGTSYLHTGLTPDTDHTYRIRSKNVSGYSDWSPVTTVKTVSSVQTFDISSTEGEEFDLVLSASNIQELDKYTFTIQYNTEDFEVTDLCGLTVKQDTQEGDISGTDITIKQAAPGTIVFTKTGSAQSWQVWSGIVNSITFKAKHDGQATITYTIQ